LIALGNGAGAPNYKIVYEDKAVTRLMLLAQNVAAAGLDEVERKIRGPW
jgi:hypothetical protein